MRSKYLLTSTSFYAVQAYGVIGQMKFEDIEIYNKIVSRDESGLELLIEKYTPLLLHIINQLPNMNLSYEDKEEIISDCFLAIWKNLKNFKIEEYDSFKPYLSKIAHNLAVNKLRYTKKSGSLTYDDTIVLPETMVSAENSAIKNILAKELLEIISGFTHQDRACVIGYYYFKKNVNVIAEELNISTSNVKIRLMRCRKKIKKELERRYIHGIKDF
jgi:RNA polymerase sigma factor (sigma-70 family)